MTLIVTALVVDPGGLPLVSLETQVCIFGLTGEPKIIAVGKTGDAGALKLAVDWTPLADYQPRLQLRMPRDGVFVEATENPATFGEKACDFGRVTFAPKSGAPVLDGKVLQESDAVAPVSEGVVELDAIKLQWDAQKQLELQELTALLTAQKQTELRAQAQQLTQQLTAQKQAELTAQAQQLTQQLTAQKQAELTAQAQQLTQQLTAQKQAELTAQSQQLTQQLTAQKQAELTAQAQQLTQQLNAQKQAEAAAAAAQHAAALAGKDAEISALGEQLAAAKSDHPPESSIEDLAQTTADQLGRVRKSLRDGQSGLELGKVSLQLKVLPGQAGGRVALPQAKQIEKVGAGALGSLELAFLPESARAGVRPQATTPRVLGYTEALARRKLGARGLGVEVIYQLVATAAEHGRVVLQRPAPDAPVSEGAVVLIAVGRQEEP